MTFPYIWPEDIKVGWWYTVCCEIDLYQIKTQEELDEIRLIFERNQEEEFLGNWWHFWPTYEEAMREL
jgi:hypothetical protein